MAWVTSGPACCKCGQNVKCSPSPSPSPSPSWGLTVHQAGHRHLTRTAPPGASFRESRGLRVALTSGATMPGTAPRSGLSTTLKEPQRCAAATGSQPQRAPCLPIGWLSYSRGGHAVVCVDEGASASMYSTPPLPLQLPGPLCTRKRLLTAVFRLPPPVGHHHEPGRNDSAGGPRQVSAPRYACPRSRRYH